MPENLTRRRRSLTAPAPDAPVLPTASAETAETPEAPVLVWPELNDYEISECKKVAPDLPIYKYENLGAVMVFRPLRAREWTIANQPTEVPISLEERIARMAIIWPPGLSDAFWANTLAGHASSIAFQVQEKSGFPIISPDGKLLKSSAFVTQITGEDTEEDLTPTEEELESIKASVPKGSIYVVDFPGINKVYVVRALLRAEFYAIQGKAEDDVDTASHGCRVATLWPSGIDWDNQPAGVVDRTFETILEASGFNSKPNVQQI